MRKTMRDLIHDTQATSIQSEGSIADDSSANNLAIEKADFVRLGTLFKRLRDGLARQDFEWEGFRFNTKEYTYLNKECHIVLNEDRMGIHYVRAELTFYREGDKSGKWVKCTYTLYQHNNSGPVLAFIGNPTTIVSGNNIRPIRVDDVSRFRESLSFYKLGFMLLRFIFADQDFQWSKRTEKRIQRGDINVSNTQWALYLPSQYKVFDLGLLADLYCSRRMAGEKTMALAEYLGFEFATVLKNQQGELTGVFLVKKKGTNHVLTVNFYDKRQSVSNKKQSLTLTDLEMKLVNSALRLDITAHRPFLQSLILAAYNHGKKLIAVQPKLRTKLKRFMTGNLQQCNAYMICRAMSILAVQIKDDKLYGGSFTTWLMRRILEEELHLISLLKYGTTQEDNKQNDEHAALLRIWRSQPFSSSSAFIKTIRESPQFNNISVSTVYRKRQEILDACGIDIFVPYTYWLDYDSLSRDYGLTFEERKERYRLSRDSKLSHAEFGRKTRQLDAKARKLLQANSHRLLHSLQLVAKPVEAAELKARMLNDVVEAK